VVLDSRSVELRRRLGPTAWVVFEELLLASTGPADACCSSVSVRSLAAQLGLAKDTVARALMRLRRAGLITSAQTRSATGTFASGSYQFTVPDAITLQHVTPSESPTPPRSNRRTRASRATSSQLRLAIDT
jgi:DNA-binding transcriptional ArsR family regulator